LPFERKRQGWDATLTLERYASTYAPITEFTMIKAAAMTAPGHIEIRSYPYPALERGAALIRMELSGICGTDKHTYLGETRQYAGSASERTTPFPIIPGHENVGIVEEIDEVGAESLEFNGERLRPGDRVTMCPDVICGRCWYCRNTFGYPFCEHVRGYGTGFSCADPPHLFGGWAEYLYAMPGVFLYKVPEGIGPQIAVLTELFAVSYAVDRAKEAYSLANEGFGAGDTVVVQGSGPMGLFCLIKARMLGAGEIIAIDRSDYRLEMARTFGADHTLNLDETSPEERIEFVRAQTGGRGADLVIECAGVPEAVPEGLEMLRKGGTYIEAGNFVDVGETGINVHRHLCAKNVRLFGVTNHPFTGYAASLRLMDRHGSTFPFERIVTHRFPLENAEDALKRSMTLDTMKVVIEPQSRRI